MERDSVASHSSCSDNTSPSMRVESVVFPLEAQDRFFPVTVGGDPALCEHVPEASVPALQVVICPVGVEKDTFPGGGVRVSVIGLGKELKIGLPAKLVYLVHLITRNSFGLLPSSPLRRVGRWSLVSTSRRRCFSPCRLNWRASFFLMPF
jgi:hypothetical protein